MQSLEMRFSDRIAFRSWLKDNCRKGQGILIEFDKTDPNAFRHVEALEEALCFGWIDGVLKRKGDHSFTVYFTERRKGSQWSEKNKKAVADLETRGMMTDFGREKIVEAKQNRSWEKVQKLPDYDEGQTDILIRALGGMEPATSNLLKMSHSVQRIYTLLYLDAKAEDTRKRRLEKIIDRLNRNLKPM